MQAHHEDRAAVNVLIKQIDALEREAVPLVTFLITNRTGVLDPAIRRRASLHLRFGRPNRDATRALLKRLLDGALSGNDLEQVVATACSRTTAYTFSDLTHRVGRMAMLQAYRSQTAVSAEHLLQALEAVEPSPAIDSERGLL
jgi:AAA+ superfamily predicted ATPase